MPRCPGQDMRYWKPEDIFDVQCPHCGFSIEFWKDEPFRLCKSCGKEIRNPRIDLGCAKWCKFANECLGRLSGQAASPVLDKLIVILSSEFASTAQRLKTLDCTKSVAGDLLAERHGSPAVVAAASLIAVTYEMEYVYEQRDEDVIPGTIFILENKQRQVLQDAGMDEESIELVVKIVKALTSNGGCDAVEFAITHDIYTIIKNIVIQRVPFDQFDAAALLTDEAKEYFSYRSGDLRGLISKADE